MTPRLLYYLTTLLLIGFVNANTEVLSFRTPSNLYTSIDSSIVTDDSKREQDILTIASKRDLRAHKMMHVRQDGSGSIKIVTDFLKVSERKSDAVHNSKNLSPVTLLIELDGLKANENYVLKTCWSALNPIDVALTEVELPVEKEEGMEEEEEEEEDEEEQVKVWLKITMKPNYYSTKSTKQLEKYLNQIVLEVAFIDNGYKMELIRWIVGCAIVGVGVSQVVMKMI